MESEAKRRDRWLFTAEPCSHPLWDWLGAKKSHTTAESADKNSSFALRISFSYPLGARKMCVFVSVCVKSIHVSYSLLVMRGYAVRLRKREKESMENQVAAAIASSWCWNANKLLHNLISTHTHLLHINATVDTLILLCLLKLQLSVPIKLITATTIASTPRLTLFPPFNWTNMTYVIWKVKQIWCSLVSFPAFPAFSTAGLWLRLLYKSRLKTVGYYYLLMLLVLVVCSVQW